MMIEALGLSLAAPMYNRFPRNPQLKVNPNQRSNQAPTSAVRRAFTVR